MYAENIRRSKEVSFVLNNLCADTENELIATFGNDWKNHVNNELKRLQRKYYVVKLKANNEPVGIYGLIPVKRKVAGIFLLTTDNLHKGNVIGFLRRCKKQIDLWQKDYELIMDLHYKKNETVKKWLKTLKFEASEMFQNDNFQVFYKGNIGLYNE